MREINTERLLLRQFYDSDAESIFSGWANDPEVTKYLTWFPHETVEITQYVLSVWLEEYKKKKCFRYGIELKETKELIGAIDVVKFRKSNPVIGFCIGRKYWNNGYMTEVVEKFTEYLFFIGYKKIFVEVCYKNKGSIQVITKVGFQYLKSYFAPLSDIKPEIELINLYCLYK